MTNKTETIASKIPCNKKNTTIVIPAKGEEKTVFQICRKFYLRKYNLLVAIARKDGQTTARICRKNKIPYFIDCGKGKGAALREAIQRVNTPYVVFFDADMSHEINDVDFLLEKLEKENADIVLGSRITGGSMELYDGSIESFFRSFFTLCINQIINSRFNAHITDVHNGFRGGKITSFRALGLVSDSFEIEVEMVMKALKKKMKICEIPSREYKRVYGTSRLSMIRHGWRHFITVLINLI